MALLFLGYAEIGLDNSTQAIRHFSAVEEMTKREILLVLVLADAGPTWHESGLVGGRKFTPLHGRADGFLESAAVTEDPNLQALAWEMKARIAICLGEWAEAERLCPQSLAILQRFDVPIAAWQVHATAWELLPAIGNKKKPSSTGAQPRRSFGRSRIHSLRKSRCGRCSSSPGPCSIFSWTALRSADKQRRARQPRSKLPPTITAAGSTSRRWYWVRALPRHVYARTIISRYDFFNDGRAGAQSYVHRLRHPGYHRKWKIWLRRFTSDCGSVERYHPPCFPLAVTYFTSTVIRIQGWMQH